MNVLNSGRLISLAASALADIKLSLLLQRFLFSIRYLCFEKLPKISICTTAGQVNRNTGSDKILGLEEYNREGR